MDGLPMSGLAAVAFPDGVDLGPPPVKVKFACQIDETAQGDVDVYGLVPKVVGATEARKPPPQRTGIRAHLLQDLWMLTQLYRLRVIGNYGGERFLLMTQPLNNPLSLMAYQARYPSRRRRIPVDVTTMVQRWVPVIRGIATGHDKDTVDGCEFQLEELLTPMLTAPVKQLREFYAQLVDALKADPTIPWFIWSTFEAWGEEVLSKAPDDDVKELKADLAREVAELVERDVMPDVKEAIAGALRWRSPERLAEIRDKVKGGHKPRLRGRESCLFLHVDGTEVML